MSDDGFEQRTDRNEDCRPPPSTDGGRRAENGSFLEVDVILDLLSDDRCRILLADLRRRENEWIPLAVLTEQVADARGIVAGQGSQGARAEIQRIAVSLHHAQLPKLDAAGVVAYDERERTCRYIGDDRLEAMLDVIREFETQ